jgi:hypothetical protein
MTDTEDAATDFDENRVPEDVHPDDVEDYLRSRFSESTMSDAAVREFAKYIAERRRNQDRVPDDPADVEEPTGRDRTGRSDIDLGEIEYDSELNRWRHADSGQFVTEEDL